MGKIVLENMQFFAHHGCFEQERIVGTNFEVNLMFDLDLYKAGQSDDLNDTLNYQLVYDVVKSEMNQVSKLIEHVAQRIIKKLFNTFDQIERIEIKLSKMNPPLGGQVEKVSVVLSEDKTTR